MQPEHMVAMLGRSAAKLMHAGYPEQVVEMFMELSLDPTVTAILAEAVNWAADDDFVNDMISERIVNEQRKNRK